MRIRDQGYSNNFHGYKKDMTGQKLEVHQIPTNTPQKELHHMDLQETIVLRIKRERERKPSSYYLRTRRSTKTYPHIIGEAPMDMMNPSVMVSRLDLVVLELPAAGVDFRRLPRVSGVLGYL